LRAIFEAVDARTRGQLAEAIEDGIAKAGVRPKTRPFITMAQLTGSLVDKDIPMLSHDDPLQPQIGPSMLGAVLPVTMFACVVVAPVEVWRSLRTRRFNAAADRVLHAEAAPAAAANYRSHSEDTFAAQLRSAERVVLANYRIERRGGPLLCGIAVASMTRDADEPTLHWLSAYRGTPDVKARTSEDVQASAWWSLRVSPHLSRTVNPVHMIWEQGDPYGANLRNQAPW
jgi:hypothetical protein